jgi:DNA-binding winged helix-turn-helix (wHTH) protein/tetratricopeptide (TPR) repeat protein
MSQPKLQEQRFPNPIYLFDDFALDLTRACLLRAGRGVKLRPKSFETLKYLVTHNNRLVSKEELMQAVWPDTFVTDDSLVQCLRDARRALGDEQQRYIKTVARRGYIFDAEVIESGPATQSAIYTEARPLVRSIAVLPFKPLTAAASDDYLGLGMADTLITKLSSLRQIVVRPTSAVRRYGAPDQDPLAAGRELGVEAVLDGSIQRSGEKVRVTARLVKVEDGASLWAYKSDEHWVDIFALQDSISEKVAEALALNLTGEEKRRLAKRYTENPDAYHLYIKGVFLRNQMTEEGLKKSIEFFQQAVELDPKYALAYTGQASSYSPLAFLGHIPVSEAEFKNRSLIMKALELDETLAEVHAALAEFKLFIEWDWEGAEREFKRAIELNPSEPMAQLLYPDLLLIKGRREEAIAMSKLALENDPISPRTGKALAWVYHFAGQYDQAIEQYNRTRELYPNYSLINLGPSYERKGMYEQAIKEYLDAETRWGMPAGEVTALRQAYAAAGWRGYWQKRLELAKAEAERKPVQAIFLAELYARLGENDQALEWLERAYRERDMSLIFLNLDPNWESLRPDPRLQNLLRRMGFAH